MCVWNLPHYIHTTKSSSSDVIKDTYNRKQIGPSDVLAINAASTHHMYEQLIMPHIRCTNNQYCPHLIYDHSMLYELPFYVRTINAVLDLMCILVPIRCTNNFNVVPELMYEQLQCCSRIDVRTTSMLFPIRCTNNFNVVPDSMYEQLQCCSRIDVRTTSMLFPIRCTNNFNVVPDLMYEQLQCCSRFDVRTINAVPIDCTTNNFSTSLSSHLHLP